MVQPFVMRQFPLTDEEASLLEVNQRNNMVIRRQDKSKLLRFFPLYLIKWEKVKPTLLEVNLRYIFLLSLNALVFFYFRIPAVQYCNKIKPFHTPEARLKELR